ncbi:MAG: hypothetical protein IJ875_07395 [Solobacterium sp.]|nr:hypothetical protein [Solobacterium sp.]
MQYLSHFYLDKEKDIIVDLYKDESNLIYTLRTPNHSTGNLIRNLAKLCDLPLSRDEDGLFIIRGTVPCYIDAYNHKVYIFRLGNTKVANIYPNGIVELRASIPSISKTLMSQTKNYTLDIQKTIIKTFIKEENKFHTDLHTHMNANLHPDILIALAIVHQLQYPLYYIRKLDLRLTAKQEASMSKQRERVSLTFKDSTLTGKYLDRKINDHTYINFADLILNNLQNAAYNIAKIRASLAVLKDGQAVFTNLEKVYLYRYVFTKGRPSEKPIHLHSINQIPDTEIANLVWEMLADKDNPKFANNTLFQDKLLWIARSYQKQGIYYVEISDTTLVKKYESIEMLKQVHAVMPSITEETGVTLRFLAALRRIPLTIIKDRITAQDYLSENLNVLKVIALDPYVAGSDIVGEEVNDIRDLKPVIQEIVKIAKDIPGYVIRIHAGENDSLRDNVYNSIACVKEALAPNQKMPHLRLGHGLYTANLKSKKGKELVKDLKENQVILEFQITSNVRLNNLNSLDIHPLKEYLKYDIDCVQGTDGAALYGTSSIDEQLSLEKLLNLSDADQQKMKHTEEIIYKDSLSTFKKKQEKFKRILGDKDIEDVLIERMNKTPKAHPDLVSTSDQFDSQIELKDQIEELVWDRFPIVLAGGSFNNDTHKTKLTDENKTLINHLLDTLNPKEYFFIIGHQLNAYEKYLLDHNDRNFKIFAIVPATLNKTQIRKLRRSNISIRVAIEASPMGLYKSFNYEIFERRPSILLALDGNSACANLIQEAKNGKGKCYIFIYEGSEALKQKAASLEGYVTLFNEKEIVLNKIKALKEAN